MADDRKLWKMESKAAEISPQSFPKEKDLEDFIMSNPKIIEAGLLLIDRQYELSSGDTVDILAMTIDGWTVILELKRGDINSRKVIGQIVDYGSEIIDLDKEDIKEIYRDNNSRDLREDFINEFGIEPPEELNQEHGLILGGTGLEGVEPGISYLYEYHDIPINGIVFDYFDDEGDEYVMNSWFNNPYEVWESSSAIRDWPTSHYLNLKGPHRSWTDWSQYGFVQAGQGNKYRQHMEKLKEGHLVYVYRPQGEGPANGYLGVGRVTQEAQQVTEFEVNQEGKKVPILDINYEADDLNKNKNDPENCEYFVGVDWLGTRDSEDPLYNGDMFTYRQTRCEFDYTKTKHRYTLRKIHSEFDFASSQDS